MNASPTESTSAVPSQAETTTPPKVPASACCGATEQATCCEPSAKASCCGSPQPAAAAPSRCGCR